MESRARMILKLAPQNDQNAHNHSEDTIMSFTNYQNHPASIPECTSISGSTLNYVEQVPTTLNNFTYESSSTSGNKNDVDSIIMNNSPIGKGKKRQRNPAKWKRNEAKLLKNLGKCYVSRTGKPVEEKVMKQPCSERCQLGCRNKFTENQRTKLFEDYWKLGSLQRQRDFLGSCVETLVTKCRRTTAAEPRRNNSIFYLLNDGKRKRVCKTFLINTFGISERIIRTVIESIVAGSGIMAEDKRGKHRKQSKIDQEILESVRLHINSTPRVKNHHLRSENS